MSDYIWAKLTWAIIVVVAIGVYAFWRGWHGKPLNMGDENDEGR